MNFRKLLFWTHLCVGVAAGLIILVMSVTGAILAFEHEIVDFVERKIQTVPPPPPDTTRIPLSALKDRIQETRPETQITAIVLHPSPHAAMTMSFGREGSVYVNPYSSEILGSGSKTHDFMHEVVDLHRWLGSREKGRPVTGAANLAFFGLALSGCYLWLKKSVYAFQGGLKGKARDWNWHNVIGFWSLPFLILITLSGAVMSYPWANNLLFRLAGSEPPAPAGERSVSSPSNRSEKVSEEQPLASLDLFLSQAVQQKPDWAWMMIRLPQKPGTPVNISLQEPGGPFPRRSQLSLNPVTGEVLKWEPYATWNRGRRWRTWARYLHTGQAGGLAGQFIAFIASLGGAVLVGTGLALAWRRYQSYRERQRAIVTKKRVK